MSPILTKRGRQRRILELVEEERVRTQSGLADRLARDGIDVNQSTISRDLKELGLMKKPQPDGGYRYAPPESVVHDAQRNQRILREFVNEIDGSGTTAVIKTDPGNANAVAEALDQLGPDPVVGTVAGDNTLFVLLREDSHWQSFSHYLEELIQ